MALCGGEGLGDGLAASAGRAGLAVSADGAEKGAWGGESTSGGASRLVVSLGSAESGSLAESRAPSSGEVSEVDECVVANVSDFLRVERA